LHYCAREDGPHVRREGSVLTEFRVGVSPRGQ